MSFICTICSESLSHSPGSGEDEATLLGAAALPPPPPNNEIVATKCGHLHHLSCLQNWFNRQTNPRQECPYCKAVVGTNAYQRIYPVGDDESEDIETRLRKAKKVQEECTLLKTEKTQMERILEQTGAQLEDRRLAYDILLFEFDEKSVQLESLLAAREEQEQLLQTIEKNFNDMIEKLEGDKADLEKQLEESEMQLAIRQTQLEQTRGGGDVEAAEMIKKLSLSHEILHSEIRVLQEQLKKSVRLSPPKRTMGSQTEAVPFQLDDVTNSMSRMDITNLCLKYFEEEKKNQEAQSFCQGQGHVLGSSARSPAVQQGASIQGSHNTPGQAIPSQNPQLRPQPGPSRPQDLTMTPNTTFSYVSLTPNMPNHRLPPPSDSPYAVSGRPTNSYSMPGRSINLEQTPLRQVYHDTPHTGNNRPQ